ncbi:MAG: hypothetical protein ACR9NN_00370 [Nostochopsis sp.]
MHFLPFAKRQLDFLPNLGIRADKKEEDFFVCPAFFPLLLGHQ